MAQWGLLTVLGEEMASFHPWVHLQVHASIQWDPSRAYVVHPDFLEVAEAEACRVVAPGLVQTTTSSCLQEW
jgi:hypothetical protein